MYRQSQWRRQVFILGANNQWIDCKIADKFTGGTKKSDPEMFPRGDGSQVNLGGDPSREDGTATYLVDEYFYSIMRQIDEVVGSAPVRVRSWPVNDQGDPWDGGFTLTGKLASKSEPDSGGGENGGATVELVLNLDDDYS